MSVNDKSFPANPKRTISVQKLNIGQSAVRICVGGLSLICFLGQAVATHGQDVQELSMQSHCMTNDAIVSITPAVSITQDDVSQSRLPFEHVIAFVAFLMWMCGICFGWLFHSLLGPSQTVTKQNLENRITVEAATVCTELKLDDKNIQTQELDKTTMENKSVQAQVLSQITVDDKNVQTQEIQETTVKNQNVPTATKLEARTAIPAEAIPVQKERRELHEVYISPAGECFHIRSDCKGLRMAQRVSRRRACLVCISDFVREPG